MPDLNQEAVTHLWPFVQLLVAAVGLLIFTAGGLWWGFVWLDKRIELTAQRLLSPVSEKAFKADARARKAHVRISRLRADLQLAPDHYDEFDTAP